MHKIKEMLHKDSEDSNVNKHSHGHNHSTLAHSSSLSGDNTHLLGGINNNSSTTTTVTREIIREDGGDLHSHKHSRDLEREQFLHKHSRDGEHLHREKDLHKHSHGEKHIYHEREVLRDGGDLYRGGEDPTLHREVISETRLDGGVSRSVVGEAQIVKEKIKEVELHKVQPVIHREREQKEIRHIVEPIQQAEVKATKIEHREREIDLGTRREASTLETSRSLGGAPQIESSREFLGTERQHQELPAQIEEHIHRRVEEHVHPVIYKETLKPRVTEEVHHLYETVKERPIETYEVKDVLIHGSSNTHNAERAFFAEHGSRGIDIDSSLHKEKLIHSHSHSHERDLSRDHSLHKEHRHQHHDHAFLRDHSGHTTERVITETYVDGGVREGLLLNNNNNDLALEHSHKDAALVEKMQDKKLRKQQKQLHKNHGAVV